MIIVSQDKYNVLNFDTTVNIGVEEITTLNDIVQISAQTNGNTIILGKYETEERAKEVLQEIINNYANSQIVKLPNMQYEKPIYIKQLSKFICYEMPEE